MINKRHMTIMVEAGVSHALTEDLITISDRTTVQVVASRILGRVWQYLNANGVFSEEQFEDAGFKVVTGFPTVDDELERRGW